MCFFRTTHTVRDSKILVRITKQDLLGKIVFVRHLFAKILFPRNLRNHIAKNFYAEPEKAINRIQHTKVMPTS
ncbi:hypothetical protein XM38_023600 [Halomicronema hongdechloris C2206]|uniref:Uncharacterized protein n=1 Tax=Halomicronema hongdechloris C2206 TaxID=1641165 RepID=A0A1Z3HM89_9CYAN|nr:hypothetical protein XM38_023600 [Halomicronema hongdechloris C2206]